MSEKIRPESGSNPEKNKHPEVRAVRTTNEEGQQIEGRILLTQEELKKYLDEGESLNFENIGVNRKGFWILRGVTAERAGELMGAMGARRMTAEEMMEEHLTNIGDNDLVLSFDERGDGTNVGNKNVVTKGLSADEHHALVRQYEIEQRNQETTARVEQERPDFEKHLDRFSRVAKQSFEVHGDSKKSVEDALNEVFGYSIEGEE